jgi:hypothetical protein
MLHVFPLVFPLSGRSDAVQLVSKRILTSLGIGGIKGG